MGRDTYKQIQLHANRYKQIQTQIQTGIDGYRNGPEYILQKSKKEIRVQISAVGPEKIDTDSYREIDEDSDVETDRQIHTVVYQQAQIDTDKKGNHIDMEQYTQNEIQIDVVKNHQLNTTWNIDMSGDEDLEIEI